MRLFFVSCFSSPDRMMKEFVVFAGIFFTFIFTFSFKMTDALVVLLLIVLIPLEALNFVYFTIIFPI